MQIKSEAARAEIIATVTAAIEQHAAALTDHSTILAWDNGLAVAWCAFGNVRAVGLTRADSVGKRDTYPTITNGNGEVAQPMPRSRAAAFYLPTLCELLKDAINS